MSPFNLVFTAFVFRQNPLILLVLLVSSAFAALFLAFLFLGMGRADYGLSSFTRDLGAISGVRSDDPRAPLVRSLPPTPPGWVRRKYLKSDGEAIVAEAMTMGQAVRFRAAGDLERFGMFARSGSDRTAQVYSQGDLRMALWMTRPELNPALPQPNEAPAAEDKVEWSVERRDPNLAGNDTRLPYEYYRAKASDGRVLELMSNAPEAVTASLMARLQAPVRP